MFRAEGDRDGERAALAEHAVHAHRAAVEVDEFLHQRQTDARAFVRAPRLSSTRWKRSNMRGNSSTGMPTPVSRTVKRAWPSTASKRTSMWPSKVNLKALLTRFSTIFSHMSRSTYTCCDVGSGGHSTTNRNPAFSHVERKLLASSSVRAARSVGW